MSEQDYVWISPGRKGGQPCIGGTRLPAEQFAQIWWSSGYTLEEMLAAWPTLTREGLIVACWFCVDRWPRTWRKRWGEWARSVEAALWHGDYEQAALPPQEGKS